MRIADTAPAYCSACFQSKPAERHVDFDVAWDGPTITDGVVDGEGEVHNKITLTIDDMIVCEGCLGAAAALIGMTDPGELAAQLEQLTEANRVLAEKMRGLEDYAGRMEAAVAAKPQPERKTRAKAGVS